MTTYNASEIDRLVREGTEDNERMTPGTWTTDVIVDTADHEVIAPNNRTWTPGGYDMGEDKPVAAAIARTRNNLPAMIAALSAAKAEVERLTAMVHWPDCAANHGRTCDMGPECGATIADRDRLAAEVERLTKERDEAREVAGIGEWANDIRQRAELAKKLRDTEVDLAAYKEAHDNALASWDVDRKNLTAARDALSARVREQDEQIAHLVDNAGRDSCADFAQRCNARVRELELTEEEREAVREFVASPYIVREQVIADWQSNDGQDEHVEDIPVVSRALSILDRLVKGGR